MARRQEHSGPAGRNQRQPRNFRPDRSGHLVSRGLFAVFFGLAAAGAAIAAPTEVPAISQSAPPEHHVGKVVFVELVTPDLPAAERFYGGLFGWTFRYFKAGTSDYAEASLDGHMVAGLFHKEMPAGEHRLPNWLSFIAARDVDAVEKIAVQKGAKVLREPHDVPDRGRQAVFTDPQGAVFAVLASSSGDTPDVLAEPGEWIWSSLIAADPEAEAAFYQSLFDYEVFDTPALDGAEHLTLATENYARASANPLPAINPNVHPHWLNFVRVVDAAGTAEKLVALGGRVLVAPHVDRHGGKIAVVADPSGAPFGLMEWPDTESKEVNK